ncbi:hypothetical protein PMZ80_001661 [Knufia obscura]|uniref:Uncharacterized protein n=1 Tax=Knufia obscura TaxID=1635080 RepID=A0ABR0S4S8_9EURO|nr:hypothetical protein PMZ80_001661 [Knufia obscura]
MRLYFSSSSTQDTLCDDFEERTGSAFATFMVTLPSDCGTCHIMRNSESKSSASYVIREADLFSTTTRVWLDGEGCAVSHEKGVFAALLYDVVWQSPSPKPTIKSRNSKVHKLQKLLINWTADLKDDSTQSFVIHKLSQYYDTFSADALKPIDRTSFQVLTQACDETACSLYFLSTRRKVEGRLETHYGYVRGTTYKDMTHYDEDQTDIRLVDATGAEISNLEVYDTPGIDFLGPDWFERDPDSDSDDEDDMEEDDYKTYTYSDSALVLIPDSRLADFLVNNFWSEAADGRVAMIRGAWDTWLSSHRQEDYDHWFRLCKVMLHKLEMSQEKCDRARDQEAGGQDERNTIKVVIETALSANRRTCDDLLLKSMELWKPDLGKFTDNKKGLVDAMAIITRLGLEKVSHALEKILPADRGVLEIHECLKALSKQYSSYVQDGPDQASTLDSTQAGSPAERSTVVAPTHEKLHQWLENFFMNAIASGEVMKATPPLNILTLLVELTQDGKSGTVEACLESLRQPLVPLTTVYELFKLLLQHAETNRGDECLTAITLDISIQKWLHEDICSLSIAVLVKDILDTHPAQLEPFIYALLPTPRMHMPGGLASASIYYTPTLADLANKHPEQARLLNLLNSIILAIYLAIDIGPEPQPNNDLHRPLITQCPYASTPTARCATCSKLNRFLGSATEISFTSAGWDNTQRAHAVQMLNTIPDHDMILTRSDVRSRPRTYEMKLEKTNGRYVYDHQQWESRNNIYRANVNMAVEIQRQRSKEQIFGGLYDVLMSADKAQAQSFLHGCWTQSLSQHRFMLSESLGRGAREHLERTIQHRGGIISLEATGSDHNLASVDDKKLIKITPSTTNSSARFGNENQENEQSHAATEAVSDTVTVTESDLPSFIDKKFADTLISP